MPVQGADKAIKEITRLLDQRIFSPEQCTARDYRWVGLCEVTNVEIRAIAWTGADAPAFPRFPVTQGFCGAAVKARTSVIVGDVRNDPRYLTTFGSTQSEIDRASDGRRKPRDRAD
jgi:GAF domain-containing protein